MTSVKWFYLNLRAHGLACQTKDENKEGETYPIGELADGAKLMVAHSGIILQNKEALSVE